MVKISMAVREMKGIAMSETYSCAAFFSGSKQLKTEAGRFVKL